MLLIKFAQMKEKTYVLKIAPPQDARVLIYAHKYDVI